MFDGPPSRALVLPQVQVLYSIPNPVVRPCGTASSGSVLKLGPERDSIILPILPLI